MTASEIAETLINGNISDARREILSSEFTRVGSTMRPLKDGQHAVDLALDVIKVMYVEHGIHLLEGVTRVQRCVKGITG